MIESPSDESLAALDHVGRGDSPCTYSATIKSATTFDSDCARVSAMPAGSHHGDRSAIRPFPPVSQQSRDSNAEANNATNRATDFALSHPSRSSNRTDDPLSQTRSEDSSLKRFSLCAVVLLSSSVVWAGDVRWPVVRGRSALTNAIIDPISEIRWVGGENQWQISNNTRLARVETALSQARTLSPNSAMLEAQRAVLLRAQGRFDDARTTLDHARSADPTVLNDFDVALTHAYLLARAGQYADAVTLARSLMPRTYLAHENSASDQSRAELALELARWSMARGRDGLNEAIVILKEAGARSEQVAGRASDQPLVRATLVLALARAGLMDQAREVARGGFLPSWSNTSALVLRGSLFPIEVDAAIGTALLLFSRSNEGVVQTLSRAATETVGPWKQFQVDLAAQARRSLPATTSVNPLLVQ